MTSQSAGSLKWTTLRDQLSRFRRSSRTDARRQVAARPLSLEPLEHRTLLSVAAVSLAWKQFDFTAAGNISGYVKGGVIPAPYKANLSGPIQVQSGMMKYDLDLNLPGTTKGVGTAQVGGTITATIPGYGSIKAVQIDNGGQTSSVIDANGNISIAVPGQTNAEGGPMVLTGKFNTKDFKVSASTTIRLDAGEKDNPIDDPTGIATWNGTIQPKPVTAAAAFDVHVSATANWDNRTLAVNITVDGPVQKAITRATAVAVVNLSWVDAGGKSLAKLSDQIPLVWNQAGGSYTISGLPTPPSAATHLKLVTTQGRVVLDTLLVPLPAKPVLSILGTKVTPPALGYVDAVFTVKLQGKSLAPVTVKYTTVNGTARSVDDFTTKSGTLTFAPGVTEQTIVVKVKRDKLESNQQFTVRLSLPQYAVLSTAPNQGICLIEDISTAAADQVFATL